MGWWRICMSSWRKRYSMLTQLLLHSGHRYDVFLSCSRQARWMLCPHCMKVTDLGELKRYSLQMGQSESTARSMHLWLVSDVEMQAMHF
jgi:hypothetical protein